MFNIEAEVRRANQRTKREEATPLVIYSRFKSYGTARLASIRDYLAMHSWPPDYSSARIISNADDLRAIEAARNVVKKACRAESKVLARAYQRGEQIDPAKAEAAAAEVEF